MSTRQVSRFLLPNEATIQGVSGQGWSIQCAIRDSLIPGAGKGRFSEEFVSSGSIVHSKHFVPMSSIEFLARVPADATITFGNSDELDKYVKLAHEEGGYSREQVLGVFGHFIWSLDGVRACLNNSTWNMNHAHAPDELNIRFYDNGKGQLIGETVTNLHIGDELRNNYKDFFMPTFYLEYCHANNFKDVCSIVMEAIGEDKIS